MKRMWLGAPEPSWLLPGYGIWGSPEVEQGLGLCVSAQRIRRLADYRSWAWPRTEAADPEVGERPPPWMLDSGAYTELDKYGGWRTDALDHAVLTYWCDGFDGAGPRGRSSLTVAWPQDWMCEPHIVARTGLSVAEHLRRTVTNLVELERWWDDGPGGWLSRAPSPFRPVVQGYRLADYALCLRMYADAGVDLAGYDLVGVGSVCRRQATGEIRDVFGMLGDAGLTRLHGFGVSTDGLRSVGHLLESADSQAWSLDAKYVPPEPGCGHRRCTNCPRRAVRWWRQQQELMNRPAPPAQIALFGAA